MSRVTAIISRSGYLCIIVTWLELLIITVLTPLPTKPARQKCQRTEAGERGNTDMQMRQRDVLLDAKYWEGVS